jgi:hypothetical protein
LDADADGLSYPEMIDWLVARDINPPSWAPYWSVDVVRQEIDAIRSGAGSAPRDFRPPVSVAASVNRSLRGEPIAAYRRPVPVNPGQRQ